MPWVLGAIILVLLGVLIFVPGNNGDNGQPNSTSTPGGVGVQPTSTTGPSATGTLYSYTTLKGRVVRAYIAPNQRITSPVRVEGNVPPGWAFEASFPVRIIESSGKVIAEVPAAVPNWMSTTTAWYAATLYFPGPSSTTGFIVLIRDNPSGLPENDDSARIPVRF